MLSRWNSYWFKAGTAEDLARHRIACYSIFFLVYLFQDFRGWTAVSSVFWMPISVFRLLPGPPRTLIGIAVLQIVWKLSLLTSAAGLLTRWSTCTTAALGCFLLGLPHNFGKIHHLDSLPILLMIIFALSRCGDRLSVDSLIWPRRYQGLTASGEYSWPVRLGQLLFLLAFGAAGLNKVWHSGAAWITGTNMRYLLTGNAFLHHAPTNLAGRIAESPQLSHVAAAYTVSIELASLPAIFFHRLRGPVVLGLLALQTGIALAMGIYFLPHLAGYSLFLPLNKMNTSTFNAGRGSQ